MSRRRRRRKNPNAAAMVAVLAGVGAVSGAIAYRLYDRRPAIGAAVGAGIGVGLVALGELESLVRGEWG